MKHVISVGCDPEFFLVRKESKRPISAHDIIPGDKLNPHRVGEGAVQCDGTAVEFNIDPATSRDEFASRIKDTLDRVIAMIPKEYEPKFTPTVEYDPKYFSTLPNTATELGCSPDFNAYNNGMRIRKPQNVGTLRTGGGHIHVGWTRDKDPFSPGHMYDCVTLARNLDTFFASYHKFWDKDKERARMYGLYGAFRPKSYGVEYRTLSNAWLNYPELWPWIFDSVVAVFNHTLTKTRWIPSLYIERYDDWGNCINLTDRGIIKRTNNYFNAVGTFPKFPEDFQYKGGG